MCLQEQPKTMQLCSDGALDQFIKFVSNFGGEQLAVVPLALMNLSYFRAH